MIVKFDLSTCRVGCDAVQVIKFDEDMSDNDLEAYGYDLARDNAEMFGIIEDAEFEAEESGLEFDESECFSFTYEVITGMTEEEIEEEYGDIENA